jgi:salicylate hydroxylase
LIVVIGAGIAGLACALGLSGVDEVVVLERRPAVAANAGAGIQLSPNAMKALDAIGAGERVRAVASAPDGLTVRSAGRTEPLVRVPYGQGLAERFGAPYLTATRAALHGALRAAVADSPFIAVNYEAPVTRVVPRAGGALVEGLDGPAGLVVAADGVGSGVRAALAGDTPRDTGWIAWRGRGRGGDDRDTELVMAPGHHLVRYALAPSDDNCVLVAPERGRDPAAIARTPTGRHLSDVADWKPWPIRVRPRHLFHCGSVVLAGDAAHAMPPYLAQGGAMALEDAATLTAAVRRHGAGAEAAAAYAATRAPRTRRLATQTDRQGMIYHLPLPLGLARDGVMRRLGPEGVLSRVDWIYRWEAPAG